MALANSLTAPAPISLIEADRRESRFRMAAATGLLAACIFFFLGVTWDIQWHADVGPETFFTAPHAMFYTGPSVGGLLSLFVVMATTVKYKLGVPGVSERTTTPWLGLFRAPVGFVITGLGALTFILSGLYDLFWHTQYGFDVTLLSPPHFGLLYSGIIMMLGTVYAFASEANRAAARGDRSMAGYVAAFMIALLIGQLSLFGFVGLDDAMLIGKILLYPQIVSLLVPLGLMAAGSLVRRPGAITLTAALFTLIRLVTWYWAPLITAVQADLQSLQFKMDAAGFPVIGMAMPAYLIVAALIMDLVLWAGNQVGLGWRTQVVAASVLGMAANFVLDPRWIRFIEAWPRDSAAHLARMAPRFAEAALPSLALACLIAALFGLVGWRMGSVLRYTDR